MNKLQYDMFLKKYQSHTHILTISNGMNMSLPPPCFSVLKMYIQRLNYKVFPMKTSEAFQIWTKCEENKWEGNRVPLDERERGWRRKTGLSPPVKYFTDRSKSVLLLWIFYVFVLSCVCYVFVRVCLYVLYGHLLGKG